MDKQLAYLAWPYSHPNPNTSFEEELRLKEKRFRLANLAAGLLMEYGYVIFSPISHGHLIHIEYALPNTHEFWIEGQDLHILKRCDILIFIRTEGWRESKGLKEEIEFAIANGIEVYYVYESDIRDMVVDIFRWRVEKT